MRINGIDYNVDWSKFRIGWSFFIPCLRIKESRATIIRVTRRLGFRVFIKPVIEEGIKGLRIWRLK